MSELLLKIEKLICGASHEELEEVRQYINHMADIKSLRIDPTDKKGVYQLENGDVLFDINDMKYRGEQDGRYKWQSKNEPNS